MATTPFNVTDLNSVLGDYAREHTAMLIEDRLYQPGALDPLRPSLWDLVERTPVWDESAWGEASFNIEVQDANNAFNTTGNENVASFNGRILKNRHMRADFQIHWRKAFGTWLNHIRKQSYQDTRNLASLTASLDAFSTWLFAGVIDKFFEKLWLQTSMKGEYAASFTTATSFDDAADGWLKVLADAVTAGAIPAAQVVAVGAAAIDNTNAYAHFEALGKAAPLQLDGIEQFLITSVGNSDDYNANFKSANAGNNVLIHDMYKRTRLEDRPNVAIIPTRELGTEDTSFTTTRDNLLFGTDFGNNPPQIFTSVGSDPLVINCTMLYGASFGVKRYKDIVINDL